MGEIADKFKARLLAEGESGEFLGYPLRLRRMRLKVLYEKGSLPLFLAETYRKATGGEVDGDSLMRSLSAEEHQDLARFELSVIIDSCLEPRLKRKPEDPGDVLIDDVPDAVLLFIYNYAMRTAHFPGRETSASESEVTAETLSEFLHDGEGAAEPGGSDELGKEVRPEAVRAAGELSG